LNEKAPAQSGTGAHLSTPIGGTTFEVLDADRVETRAAQFGRTVAGTDRRQMTSYVHQHAGRRALDGRFLCDSRMSSRTPSDRRQRLLQSRSSSERNNGRQGDRGATAFIIQKVPVYRSSATTLRAFGALNQIALLPIFGGLIPAVGTRHGGISL
jgi:hypothetical protein